MQPVIFQVLRCRSCAPDTQQGCFVPEAQCAHHRFVAVISGRNQSYSVSEFTPRFGVYGTRAWVELNGKKGTNTQRK